MNDASMTVFHVLSNGISGNFLSYFYYQKQIDVEIIYKIRLYFIFLKLVKKLNSEPCAFLVYEHILI